MQAAQKAGIPVVSLVSLPGFDDLPSVKHDIRSAARMAGQHLISCGYRRLAFLGHEGAAINALLLESFAEPLRADGLPEPAVCLHDQYLEDELKPAARTLRNLFEWLEALEKPVGILVRSLFVARFIAKSAEDQGLRVPEDVGVVVMDGDRTIVRSVSPTLSSIDFDFLRHGYLAAALLDELMADRSAEPRHRFIAPKRLIVRESTSVFVCNDPKVREAMQFIAEHVRRNVTPDAVAGHLCVSRSTLERRFQEVLGKTVFNEIRRLRVESMQRMLAETDKPIAAECGFTEANNFSRYFRKETGETPTAYRKRAESRGAE
ncbi:Xylose operon regulatory protein [Pirellulimonas nuda]|uniref:Xylose operon regulatory protein n=1 Tax=Pirellulimonas nuda TaxID=2528009 RepID=A0A518DDW3_9BACT|nr:Xylose operon regulatory protein [Pirellulimonas nuda]